MKYIKINLYILSLCFMLLPVTGCEKEDTVTDDDEKNIPLPIEGLVAYYPLDGNGNDLSENGNNATVYKAEPAVNRFGKDNMSTHFNGVNEYVEIPDSDLLSIVTTGELSISVWMCPDVYDFPNYESSGYIHWAGKANNKDYEWQFRMYNYNSIRPNRISCYAFNLSGGLGAGSYVEEPHIIPDWIHITAVYNYPNNRIRIYKNGVLKDEDTFSGYDIEPENGTSPLRIATSDLDSFFNGSIDDLRIYDRVLTDTEIYALYHEPANQE